MKFRKKICNRCYNVMKILKNIVIYLFKVIFLKIVTGYLATDSCLAGKNKIGNDYSHLCCKMVGQCY